MHDPSSAPSPSGRGSRVVPAIIAAVLLLALIEAAAADSYVGGIPLSTQASGTVSGGFWTGSYYGVAGQNSGQPNTVQKAFSIPEHTQIRWAHLYVLVYCGQMQENNPGVATVAFDGNGDGTFERTFGSESLNVPYSYPGEGGTGPCWVNDHCNRVTSDYLIWYDVTDAIKGAQVSAKVRTEKPPGDTGAFDGRIKLVTLAVAYDDGDNDVVHYLVNAGHDAHSYMDPGYAGETSFSVPATEEYPESATLSVVYGASANGEYIFNADPLGSPAPQGSFAGSASWDVTGELYPDAQNTLIYIRTGEFYKIILAALAVAEPRDTTGGITVTSVPAGAAILIDGAETGMSTNATLSGIPEGIHTVSVELAGYRTPHARTVSVKPGTIASTHFTLEAAAGSVSVSSEPSGAWVFLDGVNTTQRTKATLTGVSAGRHTVSAVLDGYREASAELEVEDGGIAEASFILEAAGADSSGEGDAFDGKGYRGGALSLFSQGVVSGNVSIASSEGYSGLLAAGERREYPLRISIPENASIREARLYVYTTWSQDTVQRNGIAPQMEIRINGTPLSVGVQYTDRKGEGQYDYTVGTACADARSLIKRAGGYAVSVKNAGASSSAFAVYGVLCVLVYEREEDPVTAYWLFEGCDVVLADPGVGTISDECMTTAAFSGEIDPQAYGSARLVLASTAASGAESEKHRVMFNDWEWYNILTGGSSGISIGELNVLPYLLGSGNTASVQSYASGKKGDYMENRLLLLALQEESGLSPQGAAAPLMVPGTPAAPAAQAGSGESFLLNMTGGRAHAAHLQPVSVAIGLFVSEGTRIVGGSAVIDRITINPVQAPPKGAGTPTFRIGPDGAAADIPLLLTVPADGSGMNLTCARYCPESGEWKPLPTRYDPAAGTCSCRIQESGIYSLIPSPAPAGESTAAEGSITPARTLIGVFSRLSAALAPLMSRSAPVSAATSAPDLPVTEYEAPEETDLDPGEHVYCLQVASNPAGALVYIDGVYTGRVTPLLLSNVSGGAHLVRLEREGCAAYEEEVMVFADTVAAIELIEEGSGSPGRLTFEPAVMEMAGAKSGGVYVTSKPSGAEIIVDGRKTGLTTPEVLDGLREGLHTISVKQDGSGLQFNAETVWVYPGAIVPVSLCAGRLDSVKQITITSAEFAGSECSVNGRLPAYALPATVSVTGACPYITVTDGETYRSFRLTGVQDNGTVFLERESAAAGMVEVLSNPPGASIVIDGFETGLCTPSRIANVSSGPHRISVSKQGYLPEEKEISTLFSWSRDAAEQVAFSLQPYVYGSLRVTSDPPGARIYLYNLNTGEKTPHTFPWMDIGTYTVRIVGEKSSLAIESTVLPFKPASVHANLTA